MDVPLDTIGCGDARGPILHRRPGDRDRPGETVIMPCGVPHAYVVTSPTARIVGSVTPGGFEGFFTALGIPVTDDADPQPGPGVPQLAEASADFGVQVLGPPPAL
jgi:hypothetical protein